MTAQQIAEKIKLAIEGGPNNELYDRIDALAKEITLSAINSECDALRMVFKQITDVVVNNHRHGAIEENFT
jgi:hypothetical protein